MWSQVGGMEHHPSLQGCIFLQASPDMSDVGAFLHFVSVFLLGFLNKNLPKI